MAAIDPRLERAARVGTLLARGTHFGVVALYVTAIVIALLLVRPAFRAAPGASVVPPGSAPRTDSLRRGESVASFAARHGLDLGELLALNPRVDSLSLKPGTKLRVG
jgi:LysM domain